MKIRIKYIVVSLLIFALLPLASCAKKEDGLSIVTSTFIPYDFCRAIANGQADITMLLSPGAEPHNFEPTPTDIAKINNCDLFVYIGGESDIWVEGILAAVGNVTVVKLIDFVDPICEEDDDEDDDDHQGHNHTVDEHIWTAPSDIPAQLAAIRDALITLDPQNTSIYQTNCSRYTADVNALDKAILAIATASDLPLVMADRFPFLYLSDRYGIPYHSALSGCADPSDVSATRIAALIEIVQSYNIEVIFIIEQSNGAIARQISEVTGARIRQLHSCQIVTKDEFDNGETYISLYSQNLLALADGLIR